MGQDQFWTMVPFLINGTITYIESSAFYGNYFENNVRPKYSPNKTQINFDSFF